MNVLLKHALDQAAVWHAQQQRKYPGASVPYMSHCAGVALLLARHGLDDEVCAAGALHDTLEDCGVSEAELTRLFGARVAALVKHVSEDDKTLSWEERKARYLEHFRVKPWEAQAITLADKADNLMSIVVCARFHGDPWSQFKRGKAQQLARYDALSRAADALPVHPLVAEFRSALAQAREV